MTPGTLVLLAAAGGTFALPRRAVRELLPLPRLDAPPGLPAPLAGFLNLGGAAVPVLDLAALLGGAASRPGPYAHLLLLARGSRALLAERVLDVRAPDGPPRPVDSGASLGGLVTAVVEAGGTTAHLLDPARLLLAGEEAALARLSEAAQRRLESWAAA